MRFICKRKDDMPPENTNSPDSTDIKKRTTSKNENQSFILAYRTEEDMRSVCRREIETLEHWTRRLIHDTLTAQYGDDYFSLKINDEPLIKREISSRVKKMRENNPGRFPRPIDAFSSAILFMYSARRLFMMCISNQRYVRPFPVVTKKHDSFSEGLSLFETNYHMPIRFLLGRLNRQFVIAMMLSTV